MVRRHKDDAAIPPGGGDHQPRLFPGVMVSSTFKDLQEHRAAMIRAIKGEHLADVVMENDSAKPDGNMVDSSLQMVRDASAYVCVIGQRYGQTPECGRRNPDNLSITELEFNEAQRLGRPILLFLMDDDHLLRKSDIETDAAKIEKLSAFRERAKLESRESKLTRVMPLSKTFTTLAKRQFTPLRRCAAILKRSAR